MGEWRVMSSPFVEDHDLPHVHNPIDYVPRVNMRAEVTACQLRPGTWDALAEWCGGEKTFDGGQAVILSADVGTARLGDWVLFDGDRFWIEPAEGFSQRFWPAGRTFTTPADY